MAWEIAKGILIAVAILAALALILPGGVLPRRELCENPRQIPS